MVVLRTLGDGTRGVMTGYWVDGGEAGGITLGDDRVKGGTTLGSGVLVGGGVGAGVVA